MAGTTASGQDFAHLANSRDFSFLDSQPLPSPIPQLATQPFALQMVEGNVRPRPRGRGAASSSVLSTPTPASSSKGKQKAGLPSFITPTAPGPPDDPWMYLRNPACQNLVRAFDNSYCTEANLDAISSMLNAAAPPLVRWPSVLLFFLY
jgi:hypothetical protein